MPSPEYDDIRNIKDFKSLIKYLRKDLNWPVDEEQPADDLTFKYDPEELGLDEKSAVQVRSAKQLRPLIAGQPWGIFWIDFESKKLPITVMRRILNQLVAKKRGGKSHQATWNLDDLLFISAVGNEKTDQREMTFAHFHQEEGDLPTLRVLGWDGADTILKIDYVAKTLKERLRWPQNPKDVETWREQWSGAFRHKPGHVIKTADALAERLAELARNIRAAAETIMEHESEKGRLRKLHKAFQTALIHDLSEKDFADTYAQTITYGLLTAAISRTDLTGGQHGTALVAENVTDMVPVTNPFLREMLETFLHVGGRKGGIDFDELGIQDVVELLRSNETDLPAILRDFNNRAEGEDPVIHFYQDFLNAYDKQLRIQRGVFYTPKPVVSYIVRGVHELLKTEFGLEDGLASIITWGEMVKLRPEIKIPKRVSPNSHFVVILDPATGTATFLVEVIDVVYKTMVAKWKKQGLNDSQIKTAWNEYVPKHLLPRLYGYELMMAPYAIAHMKIGLKLFETGYSFSSDERVRIYLTNALDEPSSLAEQNAASLFEALGHEAQMVNAVKRKTMFTVVIGNPPYSVISGNLSETLRTLIDPYRYVDGEKIEERSMLRLEMHLQDDYVKFLALSQSLLKSTGVGILGMITNNGYLDNLTLRGVRSALCEQFDELAIINLHGSRLRQGRNGERAIDQNVFDIDQGVGIAIGRIHTSIKNKIKVVYSELQGSRDQKYGFLRANSLSSTEFVTLSPQVPQYFLVPRDDRLWPEYKEYISLPDAMPVNISGIVTAHDDLVIDFEDNQISKRVQILKKISITDEEARSILNVRDNVGWKLSKARIAIRKNKSDQEYLKNYSYRPFDIRRIYYHPSLVWSDRRKTMKHVLAGGNMALATCRQLAQIPWEHVFITRNLQDDSLVSNRTRERSYHFPLFLKDENIAESLQPSLLQVEAVFPANYSRPFLSSLAEKLALDFQPTQSLPGGISAENIFHYIYAILHSPTYRLRYVEFLKIDFPRLPLTSNVELFRQLCGLGEELVALHLLEASVLNKPITKFKGKGDNVVAKGHPKYQDGMVLVNPSQGFEGVPEDVWEFHIGGYQVCEKWLKDRRERELSAEDIVHYGKVVVSLRETIRLMAEVDAVIDVHGGWPMK